MNQETGWWHGSSGRVHSYQEQGSEFKLHYRKEKEKKNDAHQTPNLWAS
jgi:hypothetical protein